MTITTAAGACQAVGWPGAFGFAAFVVLVLGIVGICAWHDISMKRISKP